MEVLTRQFSMAASAPTETTNLMGAQESYTPETFFVEAIWNMSPEDWKILEGCEWTDWIDQEDTPNPTHSGEEMKDHPAVGSKPPQEPAEETLPWFVLDQKRISLSANLGSLRRLSRLKYQSLQKTLSQRGNQSHVRN